MFSFFKSLYEKYFLGSSDDFVYSHYKQFIYDNGYPILAKDLKKFIASLDDNSIVSFSVNDFYSNSHFILLKYASGTCEHLTLHFSIRPDFDNDAYPKIILKKSSFKNKKINEKNNA